ncbi:MAG: aspA [Paenibacillus sp.]|jgi:aspartate ammonia-lyase|nr:aspA [Paenibacillus sp.]
MPLKVRIEKDFLGSKEVPAEAYYGIQTLRAVENFPITGYRIHERLITSMRDGEKSSGISKYGG